jgi:hypothetical protein
VKTTGPNEPRYWIGEAPVYPGHPVTCALIILLAYMQNVTAAWRPVPKYAYLACEGELEVPTAGGALSSGCSLIQHVLTRRMTIDEALAWGDRGWVGAGGHKDKEAPGQEQADQMKALLRAALEVELEGVAKAQALCHSLREAIAGVEIDRRPAGEHRLGEIALIGKVATDSDGRAVVMLDDHRQGEAFKTLAWMLAREPRHGAVAAAARRFEVSRQEVYRRLGVASGCGYGPEVTALVGAKGGS